MFSGRALLVRVRAGVLLLRVARSLAPPRGGRAARRAAGLAPVLTRPGGARRAFPDARPREPRAGVVRAGRDLRQTTAPAATANRQPCRGPGSRRCCART